MVQLCVLGRDMSGGYCREGIWFVSCNILYSDEVLCLLLLWVQPALMYGRVSIYTIVYSLYWGENHAGHRHWQCGCYSTHVVRQDVLWDYILRGCSCIVCRGIFAMFLCETPV